MSKTFLAWESEIKKYCDENSLDFEKITHMAMSSDDEYLAILHHDPEKGKKGLMEDDIPMPSVLIVIKENGELKFEQTEYTKQFISIDDTETLIRETA